jgi:hypothetical protein
MINKKGVITVCENYTVYDELINSVNSLPTGKYNYLIYDDKKNRSLPQLKYLFGVVLKTISDTLPEHPPVDALYRYFEGLYAPVHVCNLNGQRFEYVDLKNEKSIEMNEVISKIIHHSTTQWGIAIPTQDFIKSSGAKEAYIGAYAEMWQNVFESPQS